MTRGTPVHLVVTDIDAAVMADPFGHGFCLVEFVGRGYDEITGKP